jgi:hypothetical protein
VPQIHGLFGDGPLLPQGQGAWERGREGRRRERRERERRERERRERERRERGALEMKWPLFPQAL